MTTLPPRLQTFVDGFERMIDAAGSNEETILEQGRPLLAELIREDNWLPDAFAKPHPEYYQQYLLYCDPQERFSVISFVWGPGQKTPVHDHTVWALIGMLRGSEQGERFAVPTEGEPMRTLGNDVLEPGEIDCVSPRLGDIHRVSNVYDDRVSVSIHVYGGNIGRIQRHVYDAATGAAKSFISGYSNAAA